MKKYKKQKTGDPKNFGNKTEQDKPTENGMPNFMGGMQGQNQNGAIQQNNMTIQSQQIEQKLYEINGNQPIAGQGQQQPSNQAADVAKTMKEEPK